MKRCLIALAILIIGCSTPAEPVALDALAAQRFPHPNYYTGNADTIEVRMTRSGASETAWSGLSTMIVDLGFPATTYARMLRTRPLDGQQTVTSDTYELTWTNDTKDGLVVIIGRK